MDKKITSLAKVETNRRNGAKSKGPKTEKGKAVVRLNALKHGLLSKELVIRQGDAKEDESEYIVLLQDLCEDLGPEGIVEEMLVERIAACYWRLRRSAKFEVGVLREKLDRAISNYKPVISWNEEKNNLLTEFERLVEEERQVIKWSKRRIKLLKNGLALDEEPPDEIPIILSIYYDALIASRYITDESNDPDLDLNKLAEQDMTFEEMRGFLLKKGWNDEMLRENFIEQCIEEIEDCQKRLGELARRRDNAALRVSRLIQTKLLPDAPTMDRILRYETAIERQMYRALNQLERLQRERAGELIPPPMNVDVNMETS